VTITLDDPHPTVGIGSTGSATIVTASVVSAVAVPTSAVTTSGDAHTVTLFDGATTSTATVQVGAVGATWTQITGGLTPGQRVVLADDDQPLPSSATDAARAGTRTGTGGNGGPPNVTGGPPAGAPIGAGRRFPPGPAPTRRRTAPVP
jgi:hypothetical protein